MDAIGAIRLPLRKNAHSRPEAGEVWFKVGAVIHQRPRPTLIERGMGRTASFPYTPGSRYRRNSGRPPPQSGDGSVDAL